MAWDALFRVPLLGRLMRLFGAFPVDVRPGRGRDAYQQARALVAAGEIVGLFPEGRRSRSGWMEPTLRAGAARLALETGAPLYPATITGAYRAWPYHSLLPKPARVRVRYHDPIDPAQYRQLGEEQAVAALLEELRRRVDRTLMPGVKADLRYGVVYRMPAPFPRLYETLPPLALSLLLFWKTRALASVAPAYVYVAYLLLDHFLIPQRRFVKRLRNVSPVLFLMGWAPWLLRTLELPAVVAGQALAALVAGALFPYLYERGRTVIDFVRGFVFALLLELAALKLAPTGLGPHLALPLYAAAFAYAERTVYWRWAAPLLAAWAAGVAWQLGGGRELLPHALAGLVAWFGVRLFPYRPHRAETEEPSSPQHLSLDL